MINTNLIEWKKFKDNAYIKNLSEKDLEINLIKLAPDSSFAEHTHEKTEMIFIIDGSYTDENSTYTKGCFVIAEKGSKHATKSGPAGCEALVIKQI